MSRGQECSASPQGVRGMLQGVTYSLSHPRRGPGARLPPWLLPCAGLLTPRLPVPWPQARSRSAHGGALPSQLHSLTISFGAPDLQFSSFDNIKLHVGRVPRKPPSPSQPGCLVSVFAASQTVAGVSLAAGIATWPVPL